MVLKNAIDRRCPFRVYTEYTVVSPERSTNKRDDPGGKVVAFFSCSVTVQLDDTCRCDRAHWQKYNM